jgi:hypothetical protein
MAHPFNEAGRRLLAAVMSSQLRIGMDYCLQRYIAEEVDPSWAELAYRLQQELVNQYADSIFHPKQTSDRTQ